MWGAQLETISPPGESRSSQSPRRSSSTTILRGSNRRGGLGVGSVGPAVVMMTLTTMKLSGGGSSPELRDALTRDRSPLVFDPSELGLGTRSSGPDPPTSPRCRAPSAGQATAAPPDEGAGPAVPGLRVFRPLAAGSRGADYELRLLAQPVLRCSDPKSGLIDGTLFLLVYGTNPEVVLLIEASKEGASEPTWSYVLARMGRATAREPGSAQRSGSSRASLPRPFTTRTPASHAPISVEP